MISLLLCLLSYCFVKSSSRGDKTVLDVQRGSSDCKTKYRNNPLIALAIETKQNVSIQVTRMPGAD